MTGRLTDMDYSFSPISILFQFVLECYFYFSLTLISHFEFHFHFYFHQMINKILIDLLSVFVKDDNLGDKYTTQIAEVDKQYVHSSMTK